MGIEEQLAFCSKNTVRTDLKDVTIDCRTGETVRVYPERRAKPTRFESLTRVSEGVSVVWGSVQAKVTKVANRKLKNQLSRPSVKSRPRPSFNVRIPGFLLRLVGPTLLSTAVLVKKHRALGLMAAMLLEVDSEALLNALQGALSGEAPRVGTMVDLNRGIIRFGSPITRAIKHVGRSLSSAEGNAKAWLRRGAQLISENNFQPPLLGGVWLYTNACGDFTLMSRQDWFGVRGYPEFQIFSIHLDSLLLYQAYYHGIKEVTIPYPVYHIEHEATWGVAQQSERSIQHVEKIGLPYLSYGTFLAYVSYLRSTRGEWNFNEPNWGMAAEDFEESSPYDHRPEVRAGVRRQA
jgi:hypothetical protein